MDRALIRQGFGPPRPARSDFLNGEPEINLEHTDVLCPPTDLKV